MWRPSPWAVPVSSFSTPVAPPTYDPDHAPLVCVKFSAEWLPYVLGALTQLTLQTTWRSDDPTTVALAQARARNLISMFAAGAGGCEDQCFDFPPSASFIEWFPNDPYRSPALVGDGYANPAWYLATTASNIAYGSSPGDVITSLERFPLGSLPTVIPASGLPRFRVNVVGPGAVQLHLVNLFAGSIAQVTSDDDILTVEFVDVNRDTISLPPETTPTFTIERTFTTPGPHWIDVIIVSSVNDEIPYLFHGGGLRGVTLCGFESMVTMPNPLFRFTVECGLEISYNGEDYDPVPGWADYAAACFTGPAGPPGADSTVPGPPGEDGADSTVPGPPGADSTVPGPPGEDCDCPPAEDTVPPPPGEPGDTLRCTVAANLAPLLISRYYLPALDAAAQGIIDTQTAIAIASTWMPVLFFPLMIIEPTRDYFADLLVKSISALKTTAETTEFNDDLVCAIYECLAADAYIDAAAIDCIGAGFAALNVDDAYSDLGNWITAVMSVQEMRYLVLLAAAGDATADCESCGEPEPVSVVLEFYPGYEAGGTITEIGLNTYRISVPAPGNAAYVRRHSATAWNAGNADVGFQIVTFTWVIDPGATYHDARNCANGVEINQTLTDRCLLYFGFDDSGTGGSAYEYEINVVANEDV